MSPRAGSYDSARSSYLPPVEGGREGGGGMVPTENARDGNGRPCSSLLSSVNGRIGHPSQSFSRSLLSRARATKRKRSAGSFFFSFSLSLLTLICPINAQTRARVCVPLRGLFPRSFHVA